MTSEDLQQMLDRRFPEGAQVATACLDGGESIYDPDLPVRITPRLLVKGWSDDEDEQVVRVIDVFETHHGWPLVTHIEEYDGGTDGIALRRDEASLEGDLPSRTRSQGGGSQVRGSLPGCHRPR